LAGVTGLRLTALAKSLRELAMEESLAKDGEGSWSSSEEDEEPESSDAVAFKLPGLPGVDISAISGMIPGLKREIPLSTASTDSSSEESSDGCEESNADDKDGAFVGKLATKEERRAHKAAVKEENREKRKNKVPKHVKKRKEKLRKATR
jgi:hypothetical protein